MESIINIIVTALAFFIAAQLLSGVKIKSFVQAIIVVLVIAILDLTLGNVLKIVTLGILSLSIFNWFLNAILIQVADWFLDGFEVKNFWWSLALAAIVSILSGTVLHFI